MRLEQLQSFFVAVAEMCNFQAAQSAGTQSGWQTNQGQKPLMSLFHPEVGAEAGR